MANFRRQQTGDASTRVQLHADCFATAPLSSFVAAVAIDLREQRIAETYASGLAIRLGLDAREPPCPNRRELELERLDLQTCLVAPGLVEELGNWFEYAQSRFDELSASNHECVITALDTCPDVIVVAEPDSIQTLQLLQPLEVEIVTLGQFFEQLEQQQSQLFERCCESHRNNLGWPAEIWDEWLERIE
jgi:hypothetical protein